MGLKLRYSVHTLPWLLDFKQKIASLPVVPGTGTGTAGLFTTAGSARVAVNLAKFDRLDEVIADDEGSIIRVHDGNTIIDEWIAKRGSRPIETDAKTHELTGKPLPSIFDQYLVPAFDAPNNPAVDPNWAWGGGSAGIDGGNLLKNPSYERLAFPNGGFEDGNASPWQARNGANMFAVLNAANARTGSWHGEITSIGAAGDGAECTISGLYPGKTYTVTIYGEDTTAAGDRYRCGITDAIDPTHINAYTGTDGTIYAEIDNATSGNGSSDGTYQSFILAFTAVGDSIKIFVEAPDGAAADLKLDDCDIEGYGVGLSPEWIPLYGPYRENTFEIDKTWSTDGDQSLKWQGDDSLYTNPYTGAQAYGRTGIEQSPPLLTVGATYTFGVDVKHDSLSTEAIVLILQRVTPLGEVGSPGSSYMISKRFDVPTATTQTLELTGVADVSDVRWEVRWAYEGAFDANLHASPNINQDTAYLYKGLPPAKPGDIVTKLLDAHSEIGNWIDYSSFSATTDSNSVAWPEDIAFEVQWGEHYGHVLDRLVDIGYEWELVPKTTPVGNLTHDLHLYNTGGRDGSPSRAINKGQSVLAGEVINRIPDYTNVLLEGAGGAWSKVVDATTEADFGVLEKYVANRQLLNETTRDLGADAFLAYEAANRAAVRLTIAATLNHPRPLVDYRPGDTIPFQIPPSLPKENRRIQRIDYTNTSPTRYVVTGSRVLDGEAAAFDLLWRLWRRFTRPPVVETGTTEVTNGSGGTFTISVAASNASQQSKDKADYVCLGENDHLVINEALAQLNELVTGNSGGRISLSEGDFHVDVATSAIFYNFGSVGVEIVGAGAFGAGHSTSIIVDSASGSNRRIIDGNAIDNLVVRNIGFYGNGATGVSGILFLFAGQAKVYDCHFEDLEYGVQSSSNDGSIVQNCTFKDNEIDVYLQDTNGQVIGNRTLDSTGLYSIRVSGGSNSEATIVAHNTVVGAAGDGISAAGNAFIHHNTIHNCGDDGIALASSGYVVEANTINAAGGHGVFVDLSNDYPGGRIQGNWIIDPDEHGIFCRSSDTNIFDNEIQGAGQATVDTWDGIRIDNDRCRVMRNIIDGDSGQTQYGINVLTGASDTIVVLNDLNASADYGTGDYTDAGTATVNTIPAGGIGANYAT